LKSGLIKVIHVKVHITERENEFSGLAER
jgi:hypothetical protein